MTASYVISKLDVLELAVSKVTSTLKDSMPSTDSRVAPEKVSPHSVPSTLVTLRWLAISPGPRRRKS